MCFLDEFNRDSFENDARNKYKRYLEESNRKREIEYLLILLEGFIEEDKARRPAKIYEAYLDKKNLLEQSSCVRGGFEQISIWRLQDASRKGDFSDVQRQRNESSSSFV